MPNRRWALGACRRIDTSGWPCPWEGYGAISGAPTASTTMKAIHTTAITARRSRAKTRTLWRHSDSEAAWRTRQSERPRV